MEIRTLSLVKAITYRLLGSLTTFVGCYFFTGKATISLGVSVFDFVAKILLYYVHERIWERVKEYIEYKNALGFHP